MQDVREASDFRGRTINGLVRFNRGLSWAECMLATAAAIIFITLTLVEISGRYFFNYSQLWVPETASMMFIWSVFLIAGVCFRSGSHLVVDLIMFAEGSAAEQVHRFVVFCFNIVFALAFAYLGYKLLQTGFQRNTPVLGIPLFYGYLAPAIMGASSIFFIIEHYLAPGRVDDHLMPPSAV